MSKRERREGRRKGEGTYREEEEEVEEEEEEEGEEEKRRRRARRSQSAPSGGGARRQEEGREEGTRPFTSGADQKRRGRMRIERREGGREGGREGKDIPGRGKACHPGLLRKDVARVCSVDEKYVRNKPLDFPSFLPSLPPSLLHKDGLRSD